MENNKPWWENLAVDLLTDNENRLIKKNATIIHEMYENLMAVGFTSEEALYLTGEILKGGVK